MNNNITRSYLSDLVPGTNSYLSSFLPSTVRDWNKLPPEIAQSDSFALFKYNLNRDRTHVFKYFYSGNRHKQVIHIRLRTQCSALNHDLFKKNISNTQLCRCGSVENKIASFSNAPSTILLEMIFYTKCQINMKFLLTFYSMVIRIIQMTQTQGYLNQSINTS